MKAARSNFSDAKLKRLFKPLASSKSIAIAVSGGGDSMALLRLAQQWGGAALVALTVDHGLREDSAKEAKQVARWCKALGISHHILRWKHAGVRTGLQAKARTARYDLMSAWCAKNGVDTLLTAHTADDQAETVAMRSRRSSRNASLASIWPETQWRGLGVVRPLLSVTRSELRAYLEAIGQNWIEDPSNQDPKFERVRIRREGPSLALAATARAAQGKIKAARYEASRWMKRHAHIDASGMITLELDTLNLIPSEAKDEVLLLILAKLGGTPPDRARRDSLMDWLAVQATGRRTLGGVLFAKRSREILIGREPGRIAAHAVALNSKHPILWDNRFLISGPPGSVISSKAAVKSLKRNEGLPAFVDAGLPVILRNGEILADPFVSHHQDAKIKLVSK